MSDKSNRQLPVLPLRGVLVFPYMVIHLDVGRAKSIHAIEEAMIQDKQIFLATQKEAETDEPSEDDIYKVGCVAEIKQMLKLPGGTIRVLVEGLQRAKAIKIVATDPYFRAEIEEYEEELSEKSIEVEALMRSVNFQFEQYVKLSKKIPAETVIAVVTLDDPGRLADVIASHLTLKISDKQQILEAKIGRAHV